MGVHAGDGSDEGDSDDGDGGDDDGGDDAGDDGDGGDDDGGAIVNVGRNDVSPLAIMHTRQLSPQCISCPHIDCHTTTSAMCHHMEEEYYQYPAISCRGGSFSQNRGKDSFHPACLWLREWRSMAEND